MKKNLLSISAALVAMAFVFTSCEKDDKAPAEEVYLATGRIDPARSIATGAVTNAKFTIKYNSPNSFGDPQGVISGSFNYSGFTAAPDSLLLFATKPDGGQVSYLTVAPASAATNLYTYVNGTSGSFTFNNFPLVNDLTTYLKDGLGYIKLGKQNKFIYVLFDNVVKQ